jgi:hypothetical protein
MAAVAAVAVASGRPKALSRRVKQLTALIAAACLIAFLGFLAGAHHQRPATTTVLTGVATVGDHMASIVTGGWVYGVEGNVMWVGPDGTTHLGSWPACLGGPGNTVRVTFGEVPATGPNGEMTRQVVWVDCGS